MKTIFKFLLTGVLIVACATTHAVVKLPHFFSDNMVLQRDKPIHVWGTANRNEAVTVTFNGASKTVDTAKDGIWKVELPAMKYGGPFEMTIHGKTNSITLTNILIGDVWLCSGQSNMEFGLDGDLTAAEAIPNAKNSNIHLLTVPKTIQTKEQFDTEPTQWKVCSPEAATYFSAVGYFFGKQLQENLNIPIGLINSSWGGTDIETWTSWEASMNNSDYSKYQGKTVEKAMGFTMDDMNRYKKKMESQDDIDARWFDPAKKLSGWKKTTAPKAWDGELANEDGIVWFRTEVTLPAEVAGAEGVIQLGAIDDEDITYINGTEVGRIAFFMANRNYPVKAGILKPGKNTITVRIKDTGVTGGMTGTPDQLFLEVKGKRYPLAGDWEYKPYVLSSAYGMKSFGYSPNSFASLLYNGMIHPLVGYNIKGAIWYQGENNSGRAYHYRDLFPNMIKDWRAQWGYDFPFLWVQLASFMKLEDQPMESDWAELREAQNMTLSLPLTGQAVITDIGEAFDIHPRNKKDVGLRLAHTAMNVAYGKPVLPSGPVYDKMAVEGNKVIISFTRIGDKLTTMDKNKYGYVNGFAIAGADKKFVWAKAYIRDNKVVVFSDEVPNPVAVRYGWANNNIEINLVNSDGLLASPFRTDQWEGNTYGK